MNETAAIIKKYNIKANKNLSQNFLADERIILKIAEASEIDERTAAIEIGSGLGSLTKELINRAGKVYAIELDAYLCKILEAEYGSQKLTVINEDVMKTDIGELAECERKKGRVVKVCANLPYHLTTPVIFRLLEQSEALESLTLMVQKEVADRILSCPGTKLYGAITPAINYHADTCLVTNVPPNCFIPRPDVYSSVVRFDILREKRVFPKDEKLMFAIIKASFGQRRKTLLNALSNQLLSATGIGKEQLLAAFEKTLSAGILPSARGETLGLSEFALLADAISQELESNNKCN